MKLKDMVRDGYVMNLNDYRAGGHRSLSVGDILAIGEQFFFCASSGWKVIDRCSHTHRGTEY